MTLARRLTWVAFGLLVIGMGLGAAWDRRWHSSHPFEDFWSPPHLFIYLCLLLCAGTVTVLVCSGRTRPWFSRDAAGGERGVRLPLLPFPVPPALLLLGCGLAGLGTAGLLDGIWHTLFGLDETGWSLPHSLLGKGVTIAVWGFAACHLALSRRLSWPATLVLGWAMLAPVPGMVGGPLLNNPPPRALRLISDLPVLAADPRAQHTFRIYLDWHLDRTNPLALPLAALAVSLALATLRALTQQDRWLVAAAALPLLAALLGTRQPGVGLARLWEPQPFLAMAAAYALARRLGIRGAHERWAWVIGGWVCCAWLLVFVPRPLLAVIGGFGALPGSWLGERVAATIRQPSSHRIALLVAVVAVALPAASGALDLYLRAHTA